MACPACVECRALMPGLSATAIALCPDCAAGASRLVDPLCDRCGVPVPAGVARCVACRWHPPDYRAARAVFEYGGAVARVVLRLKYGREFHLAVRLGAAMAAVAHEAGLTAAGDGGPPVVVPVPLSPARLRARGYNQAALLARQVARRAALPWEPDALARVRDPGPQDRRTRADRLERIGGCFGVTRRGNRLLEGRRVLLVDDVITTGATASECARVLLAAGVDAVDVIAVARAVPGP